MTPLLRRCESSGRRIAACWLVAVTFSFVLAGCTPPKDPPDPADVARANTYLDAVREHLDTVIERGRDHYGESTPVFVDGLEILTYEPVKWHYDQHEWILSNLANHQDLLRTLCGMTALTGEPKYRDAAIEAVSYSLENQLTPNGLLYWGGHTATDAATGEWVGRRFHWLGNRRSPIHEVKACYPYYELMREIDPEATAQLIRTMWEGHIRDWSNLDFDRHSGVEKPNAPGRDFWDKHEFNEDAEVFFQSSGRTFVATGSDLFYSAALLSEYENDLRALTWAERLAGRYTATRDPATGLRGYQYSNLEKVDRAYQQFGDLFPDSHVSEAAIFDPFGLNQPLYCMMRLSEKLDGKADIFKTWAIEDLIAIGKHAYDPDRGEFKTMLLDGSDLTTIEFPRDGYFGAKGGSFAAWPAQDYFLCYALASGLDSDPFLWHMARETAKSAGLGDIGNRDGSEMALDPEPESSFSPLLVGLLELYEQTGRRAYLDQACRVGDRILAERFENGLFTPGPGYRYTRTSRPEALALIHLAATLLKERESVPVFFDSHAYFACELKSTDSRYTFDHKVIYVQRREEPELSP